MELLKEKYVIVEIIPTKIKNGDIAQISAIKLDGLMLLDRFDYRLDFDKINIPDILNMINFDNDKFIYKDTTRKIMNEFKKFVGDLPILFMDNLYTANYLEKFKNKESIFNYLEYDFSDDVIDKLIKKHHLEESNYIVDLLYESLIKEL